MRSSPSLPALAALAFLGGSVPAIAAEGEPKFEIMGPSTCAQWPKSGAISSARKAVPLNWTLGFLSGWAALGKLQLLDVIDADQVDTWMTDYCGAHPTVTLPLAARELERVLEAKLPPSPPPAAPPSPMFVTPQPDPPAPAAKSPAAKPKAPVPRRSRPR